MSEQPITSLEDAVTALGALPMPVGVEPVRDVEDELTGARLALFEEEQETARLRLALESARRGRRALRAEVAALREEQHRTNEWADDAAKALRAYRDRIAELEALKPAPVQECRVCGAGYTYGEPCQTCAFRARMAAELKVRGWEDPHDSPLHRAHKVPHDLEWPEPGDQR
jgi:hypothetical protein